MLVTLFNKQFSLNPEEPDSKRASPHPDDEMLKSPKDTTITSSTPGPRGAELSPKHSLHSQLSPVTHDSKEKDLTMSRAIYDPTAQRVNVSMDQIMHVCKLDYY